MASTIQMTFFGKSFKNFLYQLSFQETTHTIDEKQISFNIPEYIFKQGKDKAVIRIKLFTSDLKDYREHKFDVYYGNNKVNVSLYFLNNYTYEFIFFKKKKKISFLEDDFIELDTMGNEKLERLVLINYGFPELYINNKSYDLHDIIRSNCQVNISNSYQFTEIDLEKNLFIVKPIEEKDEFDVNFFKDYQELLKNFGSELESLFASEGDEYDNNIKKLGDKFSVIKTHESVNFNKTNEYLNNIFDNNSFLNEELFFNFFLCIYFLDNEIDFKNSRHVMNAFIKKIQVIKDEILLLEDVTKFEKIRALNAIFFTNNHFTSIDKVTFLNLKVINIPQSENNSIIRKVFNFLNGFIDGLTYDSILFPKLLYLDGGFGFYQNELVYTYDLCDLEMIKSHLKTCLPQILIFYNIENGEKAFTAAEFGGIGINEFHLFKKIEPKPKYICYDKDISLIDESKDDDVAMDIAIYLIHESFGHKKFAFTENGVQSPKKMVSSQNKLIELKYKGNFVENDNDSEYILETNKNAGDSGHFLEHCYGKYENTLIIKLLLEMKNKGKFIYRPDLFVNSGKTLKEYITLRKICEKKQIELNFDKKLTIEEELSQMAILIDKKKEDIDLSEKDKKDIFYLGNKKKRDVEEELEKTKSKKLKLSGEETNEKNISIIPKIDEKSIFELSKIVPYDEVVKIVKKRIIQKYGFKEDSFFKKNMEKELIKLNRGDDYYHDLVFLIAQYKKKV